MASPELISGHLIKARANFKKIAALRGRTLSNRAPIEAEWGNGQVPLSRESFHLSTITLGQPGAFDRNQGWRSSSPLFLPMDRKGVHQ
jgi:hypothetical protein